MAPWTLLRLERAVETFSAQLQCAICLCAYEKPVSLPCNHCFCEECIHRALELKTLCPICKTPAKKRQLRYDTTVQQLLRATAILSAAPAAKAEGEVPAASKVARGKVAGTLEQRTSPRRKKRNIRQSPTLGNRVELKQEKWARNSPLSPAVFEFTSATCRVYETAPDSEVDTMWTVPDDGVFNGKSASSGSHSHVDTPVWKTRDRIVAETPLETIEQEPRISTRTKAGTRFDEIQEESEQCRPIQPRTNQTPLAVVKPDDQTQPLSNVESDVFQVGNVVEVIERQWVGINKQGGAARITKVHGDGFYAVKFVIGGKDNRVPGSFIRRPTEELISDSTPSRSVKERQRRRVSDKMNTPDLLATETTGSTDSMKVMTKTKKKHSGMVFLCSGFKEQRMQQIDEWADLLGAEVVQHWSNDVTHLIVKCVSKDDAEVRDPAMEDSDSTSLPNKKHGAFSDSNAGRWVKIRSLKYLKALVGGRWIVSEEWLQACAEHGGYVKEANYEADGYWKGRRIRDVVKRSRLKREKLLQLTSPDVDRSTVGTTLFADFSFYILGEFLPPMPPATELKTLICIGGGQLIALISDETHARKLIIVSDKINPIALRQQTRQLKAQPQMKAVSSAIIVNYLWVINSISEAKLRELPRL